jgi:hypothetical protein
LVISPLRPASRGSSCPSWAGCSTTSSSSPEGSAAALWSVAAREVAAQPR